MFSSKFNLFITSISNAVRRSILILDIAGSCLLKTMSILVMRLLIIPDEKAVR